MSMMNRWLPSVFFVALAAALMLPASADAAPSLSGILPDHAPMQSFLTIYGSGFGDFQGTGRVTLGGRAVPVSAWADNAIHVIVNPLAYNHAPLALDTLYPIQVITNAGTSKSNTINFTLDSGASSVTNATVAPDTLSDQPTFECFNKTLFCPGDNLTIFGAGFGDMQGSGYVTITAPSGQEFAVPVISWSEHAIYTVLSLPAGAQPGTYTATVHRGNGKTVSASFNVGLTINGACVAGLPMLQLSCASGNGNCTYFSFGCVIIGHMPLPTICFTITNTGTGPLNFNASISDPYMGGFSISSGGGSGTLAPGQSQDICVTFAPHDPPNTFDALVTVTSNAPGGPVVVQFHGTGAHHPIPPR
jgi:HYDIN/CFA65/VesB family protein/IPT/TIG domain-containing protein